MKKTFICLLVSALALTALTACDNGSTQTPETTTVATTTAATTSATTTVDPDTDQTPEEHTHTAASAWQIDKDNHWHVCECGEVIDSAAHTTEDDVCTVCEAEIYTYEDGTVSIYQYNEYGDFILSIDYDESGKETTRTTTEHTYDEDGNPLTEKQYTDGKLSYECEYKLDEEGYAYPFNEIVYYEDGSKAVYEYDENYEMVSEVWYNADGSLMDNSDKFDADACKDLVGTWVTQIDMADLYFEFENLESSCTITVTMILTDKGEMSMTIEVDEDEIRNVMYEVALESVYVSFEEEGLSRAEADAAFEAQMGMTISEYVEAMLAEADVNELLGGMPEAFSGVYYVENGMLCAGDSWNQPLDGVEYTLNGSTLTLVDDESEMELVFTKVTE